MRYTSLFILLSLIASAAAHAGETVRLFGHDLALPEGYGLHIDDGTTRRYLSGEGADLRGIISAGSKKARRLIQEKDKRRTFRYCGLTVTEYRDEKQLAYLVEDQADRLDVSDPDPELWKKMIAPVCQKKSN